MAPKEWKFIYKSGWNDLIAQMRWLVGSPHRYQEAGPIMPIFCGSQVESAGQ
jgi:hypothetical protein